MTQSTEPPPQGPRRRPPAVWPIDILNGAFRGDYCTNLGYMGYITQGICGFLPGIGSLCAFRDFFAAMRHKDRLGMVLNGFSVLPIAGGFPKTAHVIRGVVDVSQAASVGYNMRQHHIDKHAPPPTQA
jgi:hypothetical protein